MNGNAAVHHRRWCDIPHWGRLLSQAAFLVWGAWFVVSSGGTPANRAGDELALRSRVPAAAWAELAHERVFFGHQSVGADIVRGITDLAAEDPSLGIRVVEGDTAPEVQGGVLVHARIGRNGEPGIKTDEFAALVEGRLAGRVDVAFHKYCYADILADTDVAAVFRHYRLTMARLRAEHPEVVLVHVTTPLVRVQSGPKALAKKLLGKSPGRYAGNMARERFNNLMRQTYGGREPLFDLAAIESTRPDGSRQIIDFGGRSSYALVPAYTEDGSHLNAMGRKRVAEELLVFLAELPGPAQGAP